MSIADKTILITGASRGIGRALADEALRRGATRVYAAARRPAAFADERVTPLTLDVTDAAQVRAAAERVGSLDILVNDAGLALYEGLGDRATLERHLAVNLFGTYAMSEAFLPALTRSGGVIVNNLSLNSLAPLPVLAAYSVSKAAAFSLTQSLRTSLADRGVRVHAVLIGPTDTDMPRDLDLDEDVLLGCFARAFDAWDNNTKTVNTARLQNVADKWANDMFAAEVEGLKMLEGVRQAFIDIEKSLMPTTPNPRPAGPAVGPAAPKPAGTL